MSLEREKDFDSLSAEELFATGVQLFNDAEFYECHEVLEALWNRQLEPEKQFTQGVIQIAVGLYHASRGNLVGANKLLPRGLARVRPFAPEHRGLKLLPFIAHVQSVAELLSHSPDLKAGSGSLFYTTPKLL
jgi:uncharacterized protein